MKKIVFSLLISALVLSACRKDDPAVDTQDNRQIVLFLSTQSTSSSLLKASTVAANLDEKRIDKVILYSVDEGGNILKIHPVIQNPKIGGEEISIPRKTKSMYAIANPSNGIIGATPSTVSDLVNLTGDFPAAPEIPLLMGGMGPVNSYSVNVELIRAVAKINIKGTNGFKIGSITVQNTPDSVYVFKRTPLAIPGHVNMVSYTKMEFYPPVTDTTLYVPENSKGDSTVFVVTGDIDNEPVEYIFSLKSGGKAIDIVRNTRYQVSINPAAEPSGTITISMPDWDEGESVDEITDDVPSTPNPYKNGIKILAIGNSYSHNAMQYMPDLLRQLGVDEENNGTIRIVAAYESSQSLSGHASNALNDYSKYYRITSISGDDQDWDNNPHQQFGYTQFYTFEDLIQDDDWDVITLQQASGDSGNPTTYGDLGYLVNYIEQNATPGYKLGWHMTWAWGSDNSSYGGFYANQNTMYAAICSTVQSKILTKKDLGPFDFIIPAGTAIQNARSMGLVGNPASDLTWDNSHLNNLGCYIAAAMWVRTITGYDLTGLDNTYYAHPVYNGPGSFGYNVTGYQITQTEHDKVIQAVNAAAKTPFAVTTP